MQILYMSDVPISLLYLAAGIGVIILAFVAIAWIVLPFTIVRELRNIEKRLETICRHCNKE